MKAIEFTTRLADEKHIDIPLNFQKEVQRNKKVRVLILVDDENADETTWKLIAQQQFLKGYSEADSIYDNE